jgi:class 3 adenylate cyclase/tetratricopeptide (TPR) repeat protein
VAAGTAQDAVSDQVVRIRLLGQFAITSGSRAATDWPRPTARRLCELVLVSPGRRISRDLACDELFPRLEPRTAARSLSKALSMARGALAGLGEPGTALLAADLGHIWVAGSVEVDAETHAAALRAGLAMAPGMERDETLAAALAEDGELLAGEPYADWAAGPRERLDALRQEARLALARDRAMGSGRSGPDDVLAAWQSCQDHDPACEEAAGALVRGYFARGRPELAARAFERCRAALEQLGLRISPSLERVYAAATRDPSVPAASPAPAPPQSMAQRDAGPSSEPHPQQLPREERRPVSVLFAEVAAPPVLAGAGAGATTGGALGLEALRDVVGGSLAAVIAEVEALGGTVISVSGRGLEAMFGAPEAHEDDPERALRAAFRALAVTAAAADGGTALRIGVETGPAVVGPVGGGAKVEYGAFGDVVSVAAALQSSARPGSVLVGPATRAVTGHLFSWGAAEEVALGGHPRPLVASYLDAPRARVAERRPRLGGRATLVDRDAELRVLDGALRAAVSGHGSVVLLTAEPGLGKTRMVQECRKRFIAWVGAGSGRLPLWLEGRCASYASAVPYSLYRQLVASWIGVSPDQPEARLRPALETALVHLTGNTNLLPPLARMMGAAQAQPQRPGRIGPEELQRMTFGAVRSVVSRFAAAGPTVLVLEDLHWADPTSLRLTLELAELAAGRPLLVLATARPDAGPEVAALAAREETRQLALRPLSADAAETLASDLIGGQVAGPEVLAAVLDAADGNPLFLEERLSSLLETRTLVREQGTWRLRRTHGPEVPEVLERLVRARVDRLGPAAQEAIRAAAVLGTEFTAPLLAAVLRKPSAALEPVLGELSASDLVHREQAVAAAQSYRFRHALLQEAVYLGLLRAERRGLHARAAAAIKAASSDRLPEVAAALGRHYAAAANAAQAIRCLELAGDHATDAFANEEAIASFRAALALTARQAEADATAARAMAAAAVRLRTRLANVLWRTGRREEAKDEFRAALRLGDAVDPLMRAHLHTRLGRLELTSLDYEAAQADFDAAEALLGDPPGAGEGAGAGDGDRDDAVADQWLEMMIDGRADLHVMRFEQDRALEVLEAARPVLETHGTPARRYVFDRLFTQQRLIRNRFQVDDADIARLRGSLRMAEHTGEEKDLGYATNFLGWALWLRGDLTEAEKQLQDAHDMAERMGETFLRAVSLLWLTLTALRQHDTEEVRALLPRAADAVGNAGNPLAGVMACQAWLAWQDGCPDDVLRLADELADSALTTVGVVAAFQWVYLFPLIAARLGAGQVKEAVTVAKRLLDPVQQRLPGDLTAALRAATEAWDQREPSAAEDHLESALRLARDLSYF